MRSSFVDTGSGSGGAVTRPCTDAVIVAVSTVKDTPDRLARWVDRNLRNGVDHIVAFVDDDNPEALARLTDSSHVTAIGSSTWWGTGRPQRLNVRQRLNANTVMAVARGTDIGWVLHIDADEVALLDRPLLDALPPPETIAVHLAPYEATSQRDWPPDAPHRFKCLLTASELHLLKGLGVITGTSNGSYFHGHVGGKVAARPMNDVWLGTHRAVNDSGERHPAFHAPGLRLLHYESHTADEFIRKWSNLTTSGSPVVTRGARTTIATAVRGLLELDLDQSTRHEILLRLFDRYVKDDVETLDQLGLLVTIDPDLGQHQPDAPSATVAALRDGLARLNSVDKRCFQPGGDPIRADMLLTRAGRRHRFARRR